MAKKTHWNFIFFIKMPNRGGEGSEGGLAKDHTFSRFFLTPSLSLISADNKYHFLLATSHIYSSNKSYFLCWLKTATEKFSCNLFFSPAFKCVIRSTQSDYTHILKSCRHKSLDRLNFQGIWCWAAAEWWGDNAVVIRFHLMGSNIRY